MSLDKPSPPRVVILGLRGIPSVQGGVETHVAGLASRLVKRGWQVEVLGRSPYLPKDGPRLWQGVEITPVWAPRSKGFEAIVHTALGLLVVARRAPDVVHIHAIGPALLAPLARLTGARVVVTHHGYDYERQKWGSFAKWVLRLGERFGMTFAHARIGVAAAIATTMRERYGLATAFIPNGVDVAAPRDGTSFLARSGIVPRRYVLMVARIVEEKRQIDLIAAFARMDAPGTKLVIVGGAEHGGRYLAEVEAAAKKTPDVLLVGPQTGEALAQLYDNAALFVLPSSHEGMPIVLLEALAYGLPVLASDIPANLALDLDAKSYFPLGDIEALATAMAGRLATPHDAQRAADQKAEVTAKFGWDVVADQTASVYEQALRTSRQAPRDGDRVQMPTGKA